MKLADSIKAILPRDYQITGMFKLEDGFSVDEKAIYEIKDGEFRLYKFVTPPTSVQISKILQDLEGAVERLQEEIIQSGQKIYILKNAVYIDDSSIIDVQNGEATMYSIEKRA